MKEVISERAKIREMSSEELIAYIDNYIGSKQDWWGWWLSDDLCNYISKQYQQLTGNPLF